MKKKVVLCNICSYNWFTHTQKEKLMKLFILATFEMPKFLDDTKKVKKTRVLETYFNIRGGGSAKVEAIELQKELTMDKVSDFLLREQPEATLLSFQVLAKPRTRWVSGEYYAHEHDQYLDGRARLVKWSETFQELEVECLDKSVQVLDGIWAYESTGSGKQNNGCGDTFSPDKMIK